MSPTARDAARTPSPLGQSHTRASSGGAPTRTRELTLKPEVGAALAGKYRLERVLGEGGMSTVFAAINLVTGKQVAIKWLHPEVLQELGQSQQLLREAQAASAVDHPNVVNVFDVGWHQGALFLVMELLHGEPLSELLAREQLAPSALVKLLMPVLRGVHAAHRMGVVHRDLKPDNIFLCRDPHGEARGPKVLDFGISKLGDDGAAPGRAGTVFGTPQYMAPEQLRDARLADARSDVYALGAIFYRALSREYPYDADTLTALTLQVLGGDAPPLQELCPELERGLCAVVMRALELDPARRFQSVAELAQALAPYADRTRFAPAALEVVLDDPLAPFPARAGSPLMRTLLGGVALFALGSFAPIGWQLWHSARGTSNTISAISTKVGSGRPEPTQAPAHPAVPADALPARDSAQLDGARTAVEARAGARERNDGAAASHASARVARAANRAGEPRRPSSPARAANLRAAGAARAGNVASVLRAPLAGGTGRSASERERNDEANAAHERNDEASAAPASTSADAEHDPYLQLLERATASPSTP